MITSTIRGIGKTPRMRSILSSSHPLSVGSRQFLSMSAPRRGHNLEDFYDLPEWQCCMNNPAVEYLGWSGALLMVVFAVGPLLHSNYYFGGRFFPRPGGDAQMCEDSW